MININTIRIHNSNLSCIISPNLTSITIRDLGISRALPKRESRNFWENLSSYLFILQKIRTDPFFRSCVKLGDTGSIQKILSQIIYEKGESFETEGLFFTFLFEVPVKITAAFTYDSQFKFLIRNPIGFMNKPRDDRSSPTLVTPCQVILKDGHFYFEPSLDTYFNSLKEKSLK